MSARVRVYPGDAVLPADGFLPSADAVKTASVRTLGCVRADVKKNNFGSSCRLGKKEIFFNFQFSIFGFRFSIPKIPKLPKLPELRGLRGRSREKKKVFSA
jgi:hypothetical protein